MTYTEAISSPDASLWKASIQDEYDSLMENGTWELCLLPADRQTVSCKWVFDYKRGYTGVLPRYKTRLVVRGFTQEKGIDFDETFSPVATHAALRVILSLVAVLDLEMTQLDVKTAFLYGTLEHEIYMDQPEGFVVPGRENEVCRLIKSIYGLKQAPRVWNEKFNSFLLKFGLTRCDADQCIYYRQKEDGEITFVIIYVDDGLICSNRKETAAEISAYLSTEFKIRTLPANRFLGVDITRNRENRELFLCQSDFIARTLKKFSMESCNPKATPSVPGLRLTKDMCPTTEEDERLMKDKPYSEAIGSLMYLSTMTRPDIAFSVSQASRFSKSPGLQH